MKVPEEVEPRSSPSIVKLALCQNTQQCGLARVNITQYSYSQVQELWDKIRIFLIKQISNKRTSTRK